MPVYGKYLGAVSTLINGFWTLFEFIVSHWILTLNINHSLSGPLTINDDSNSDDGDRQ